MRFASRSPTGKAPSPWPIKACCRICSVKGALDPMGTFRADSVLAKHDENYMPKEVADSLKKQGHWKDEYEKKAGAARQGRAQ